MASHNPALGIILLIATIAFCASRYFRASKRRPFPGRGWAGLAIILGAEFLLFYGTPWVVTFFTPMVWTGYLLFIDGVVASLRGDSRLMRDPWEFLSLAFWSVPLWLIFEAYNLRLENWDYIGMPDSLVLQLLGGVWAFATIWPAIFETAEFIEAAGVFKSSPARNNPIEPRFRPALFILGLILVTVPVVVPARDGAYLFGAVWVGYFLLLDPINCAWKGRSLLGELDQGITSTFWSFMLSGWVCGILWEFWNYWAGAKWIYVFPIGQRLKIFEMPILGYLGFPAFALESFAMYAFVRNLRQHLMKAHTRPGCQVARLEM